MFAWVEMHHRFWRIALLVLLLVAFLGPWTFDVIYLPPGLTCSADYIQLNDNLCGFPLSGIWLEGMAAENFIHSSTMLVTGELVFTKWIREFLFSLLLSLPLLPILGTLLLILGGGNKRRQVFTISAWILAVGFGLFLGLNTYPRYFWAVWGIWLYIGLAIIAWIMEGKNYRRYKDRENQRDITGGRDVMD